MPDQAEAFVAALPVAKFHGVGPKTTVKMRALGIETGSDLRRQTLDFLQDRFGKSGSWYYNIARGRDERSVQPDRERKSLGSETTFPEDRTDPVQIEASVIAMANDVWTWCEKTNSRGRTITVKIKMGRLSDIHSQPVDGNDDSNEGEAASGRLGPDPVRLPAAERRSTRRRGALELSIANRQRSS
jgi:nucleotidyltransferase/DNA polymerase involved in DNA repair